eukprot:g22528.t1
MVLSVGTVRCRLEKRAIPPPMAARIWYASGNLCRAGLSYYVLDETTRLAGARPSLQLLRAARVTRSALEQAGRAADGGGHGGVVRHGLLGFLMEEPDMVVLSDQDEAKRAARLTCSHVWAKATLETREGGFANPLAMFDIFECDKCGARTNFPNAWCFGVRAVLGCHCALASNAAGQPVVTRSNATFLRNGCVGVARRRGYGQRLCNPLRPADAFPLMFVIEISESVTAAEGTSKVCIQMMPVLKLIPDRPPGAAASILSSLSTVYASTLNMIIVTRTLPRLP